MQEKYARGCGHAQGALGMTAYSIETLLYLAGGEMSEYVKNYLKDIHGRLQRSAEELQNIVEGK